MTDSEIIKALECCAAPTPLCFKCPLGNPMCGTQAFLKERARKLINRQKAEIERLEFALLGVMHSVDKWLDGAELDQDEVNRAATMREKTLQIVESAHAEAIKKFAERLKTYLLLHRCGEMSVVSFEDIDKLVKEMVGED